MKQFFIILTVFLIILVSCEKDSGFGLEIYLLTDYQTKSPSKEIIAGSEKLSKNPIVNYHDIMSYDSTERYLQIETSKAEELNHISWDTQGTAFSLTIDKMIIYSGYFMPSYSSSGADWFIIDPLSIDSKIYIRLGYPGELLRLLYIDPRNDDRIISLLRKDNKLN
jgi:hypothetical protein